MNLIEDIIHTVLSSQEEAFASHVNAVLKNDEDMKDVIPIPSNKIFDAMHDGIIFCKLVNAAVSPSYIVPPISPEALKLNPTNMYQKIENLNLAIESARSIGCIVVSIQPSFIMEKREHIVLGLIWQIIKIHIDNRINLKMHPEIILLKNEDESPEMMHKLGYEEILIRWLNFHIRKNGGSRIITNLGKDMADSQAYGHVLTNVSDLGKEFWDKDQHEKAGSVIEQCHKENIQTTVKPIDIMGGNQKLNTLLCVDIFNQKHGLYIEEEKIEEFVEIIPPQEPEKIEEIVEIIPPQEPEKIEEIVEIVPPQEPETIEEVIEIVPPQEPKKIEDVIEIVPPPPTVDVFEISQMGKIISLIGRLLFITMILTLASIKIQSPERKLSDVTSGYENIRSFHPTLGENIPSFGSLKEYQIQIVDVLGAFEVLIAMLILSNYYLGGFFFTIWVIISALAFQGIFLLNSSNLTDISLIPSLQMLGFGLLLASKCSK